LLVPFLLLTASPQRRPYAHGLSRYLTGVIGRDDADPERMKPSPYRVREAVGVLGGQGEQCAFVGSTRPTCSPGS